MRINKYVALATGVSRRQADELVSSGAVTVSGKPARLGQEVGDSDVVTVNNQAVNLHVYGYLLFHKPTGYVCSRKEQGSSPTIYSILPNEYHHLKPVGRLDKDSSGLLLLTNDGDFAQTMIHPKFAKTKVYQVELDAPLNHEQKKQVEAGIKLNDGVSRLKLDGSKQNWTVTMAEGRNRQIRRTFKALGITVNKLHRTAFGPYRLGDLQPGKFSMTDKTVD